MCDPPAVRSRFFIALWVLLAFLVFAFDVLTPLGVAASVVYAAIMVLTVPLLRPKLTLALAGMCTALTALSVALTPWIAARLWPRMSMVRLDTLNQILGLLALWVVVILVLRRIRSVHELHEEMSQRRQAEELAELRRRELSEFLHITVHDLGHPVVGMRNLLMILRRDWSGRLDPASRENLDLALGECLRMEDWLQQLGRMARTDLSAPQPQSVRLDQMLQRCLREFRPRLEGRPDLRVSVRAPGDEVRICLSEVEESVINLIDNALKYACAAPGSKLDLAGRIEGQQVLIDVADSGPGISPLAQARLFNFFERLDPEGPIGGSGVGLAAVRRLMRRIGGQVRLHSNLGQGSTFTLQFPVLPVAAKG